MRKKFIGKITSNIPQDDIDGWNSSLCGKYASDINFSWVTVLAWNASQSPIRRRRTCVRASCELSKSIERAYLLVVRHETFSVFLPFLPSSIIFNNLSLQLFKWSILEIEVRRKVLRVDRETFLLLSPSSIVGCENVAKKEMIQHVKRKFNEGRRKNQQKLPHRSTMRGEMKFSLRLFFFVVVIFIDLTETTTTLS